MLAGFELTEPASFPFLCYAARVQKERENLTAELEILRERNEKNQKQLDRYQRECHQALQDAKMYREKLEGLQSQLSRHQEDQELSKAEHEMMIEKVKIESFQSDRW